MRWGCRTLRVAALVVASAFLIRWADLYFGYAWVRGLFPREEGFAAAAAAELVSVLGYLVPVGVVVALLHGRWSVWRELGLHRGLAQGAGYGLVFSLPMLVWYARVGRAVDVSAVPLLVLAQFRAAFREEVFYRAFLFGQLFAHGRWGFVPAVGLNALVFALGHLSQAGSPAQAAGIFVVTLFGAVWFAWLFLAWEWNLWVPVALHFFMNLWWELFAVGQTAFSGSLAGEVPRLLTVAGSVAWSLWLLRRRGRWAIPPGALWWRPAR